MTKTIAICGSMKFASEMKAIAKELEKNGWHVYLPDLSEKSEQYESLSNEEKQKAKKEFIFQHFHKIERSDAILVANYEKKGIPGYIGANTLMEIAVAASLGKDVFLLNEIGDQNCSEEVNALATNCLKGDISAFSFVS